MSSGAEAGDPKATEQWEPVPRSVIPGTSAGAAPSDAIVLFDGKNLDEWISTNDRTPARWNVHDGIVTVDKEAGNIETRKQFRNYQLHLEYRIPQDITGKGQARGNSGLFLASTGSGDAGYEIQILDSYKNETYVNGQAGKRLQAITAAGERHAASPERGKPTMLYGKRRCSTPTENCRARPSSPSSTTACSCRTTLACPARPSSSASPNTSPTTRAHQAAGPRRPAPRPSASATSGCASSANPAEEVHLRRYAVLCIGITSCSSLSG